VVRAVTGPRPHVFLSHSGYAGETKATLEAVAEALEHDGFTPLLDRHDVVSGSNFHHWVHNMIAVCNAAVVLMDERAFARETPWVFNEVSRLQPRSEQDEGFQLLPLYASGITPDHLRNSDWHVTHLDERDKVDVATTPSATARAVVAALRPTRERFAAGVVEREIAQILRSELSSEALRGAARGLVAGYIEGDVADVLARHLIVGDFTRSRKFLLQLRIDPNTKLELLQHIMPFKWVPSDAASAIPAALAEGRPIAINSNHVETVCAYVHCATTVWPAWAVRQVGAPFDGDNVDDIVDQAQAEVDFYEGVVEFPSTDGPPPDADAEAARPLVILTIECPGFEAEMVAPIQAYVAERGRLGVVLRDGHITRSDLNEDVFARIRYLSPELDRGNEEKSLEIMKTQIEEFMDRLGIERMKSTCR
jgi:hypothetical protein